MAFTITHPDDDRVLLDVSGAELSAHVLRCHESYAHDLACIVTAPNDAPLHADETSVADQIWALVLELQRISNQLSIGAPSQ